ncbi:hypothetical protein FGO68_gene16193 [Halteria grandinella]|uniref:Peptidase M14 domain-containing protein n=1 Tax=Halteria grandinella TaxID=5974 RepID=A0A8J8P3Z3_HALGN|nr:hypothetical protein FGO68_gene16193 [Halteria grandinella]
MTLDPDMIFGWRPQVECTSPPIPLFFDFTDHPIHIYKFHRDNTLYERDILVYQERRPKDSYQLHQWLANKQGRYMNSYQFKYPKFHDIGKFKYDDLLRDLFGDRSEQGAAQSATLSYLGPEFQFVGTNPVCAKQNAQGNSEEEMPFLKFDSQFESGNLDLVVKPFQTREEHEYDVFLRPDSNTIGSHVWFFFSVSNRLKGTKLKINIVNMTKRNSLYVQGLSIQHLSQQRCRSTGQTWQNIEPLKYAHSKLNRGDQVPDDWNEERASSKSSRYFYQLSFIYEFEYDEDTIYFSYSRPYTFSMALHFTKTIAQQQKDNLEKMKQFLKLNADEVLEYKIFDYQVLTQSLGGVDVPLITITNNLNNTSDQAFLDKKYVIITARVHPGETNSSHVLHEFLRFILSQDRVTNMLRDKLIFKIIPMINPDGVIVGNNRCSFIGKDINRCYQDANAKLTPEIYHLRQMIGAIVKQSGSERIAGFFDLHQHSGRKSVFMYAPYYPLHSKKYLKIRMLPKLLAERSEMFRYYSCKFRFDKFKEGCARLALWKDFHIENSYTIEISAMGFLNAERETIPFTEASLGEFGKHLAQSLCEYLMIKEQDRRLKEEISMKLKKKRMKQNCQTSPEKIGKEITIRDLLKSQGEKRKRREEVKIQILDTDTNLVPNISTQSIVRGINLTIQKETILQNPNEPPQDISQQAIQIPQTINLSSEDESDYSDDDLEDYLFNPRLQIYASQTILDESIINHGEIKRRPPYGFNIDLDSGELFIQAFCPSIYEEWKVSNTILKKSNEEKGKEQESKQKFFERKIRTLEEVYGQIRDEMQQQQLEEESNMQPEYNKSVLADEGLFENDRKILNRRILGIMGLFTTLADPNAQLQNLDQKQLVCNIHKDSMTNEK